MKWVTIVEPDQVIEACQASPQVIPAGIQRIGAQTTAYPSASPIDIDVAIIDTGIDLDHPDLYVILNQGICTIGKGPAPKYASKYDDDNGHGTHVAGIVGALDNDYGVVGVAPGARLWPVKVLDANGSGSLSSVIAGVDWVTRHASDIEVANMSLSSVGYSQILHTAIQACVGAGVVVVVAAGNHGRDVYGWDGLYMTEDDIIPAAFPEVMTVSAMADTNGDPGDNGPNIKMCDSLYKDNSMACFSNFSESVYNYDSNPVSSPGHAIDLIMPGVDIYSTYRDNNYATLSGTSMAAPHAAGLVARYLDGKSKPNNLNGVYNVRQDIINQYALTDYYAGDKDGDLEKVGWLGGSRLPVNHPGEPPSGISVELAGTAELLYDGNAKSPWAWRPQLTVKVIDPYGNPIPGAVVKLWCDLNPSKVISRLTADVNGEAKDAWLLALRFKSITYLVKGIILTDSNLMQKLYEITETLTIYKP
ncbi:MAG: S8 family serine peptidase [bacterium]